MINIEKQIASAKTVDELKPLLRELQNAINTLAERGRYNIQDQVFSNEDTGPVVRNKDDGHFYRLKLSGTSTVSVSWTDLGKTRQGL